jgi:hypothetical protein
VRQIDAEFERAAMLSARDRLAAAVIDRTDDPKKRSWFGAAGGSCLI